MSVLAESYRKVFYDLRPGKQIERRLLLDAFQHLSNGGFALRDSTYLGFGSISFYDFALFYRYLGFKKMISLENDPRIKKRVLFNRPFNDIDVLFMSPDEFVPKISLDRQYVVWLDFDLAVSGSMLADVGAVTKALSAGSILIVTVDGRPPQAVTSQAKLQEYVRTELTDFLRDDHLASGVTRPKFRELSRDVLGVAVSKGLKTRRDAHFAPLFSFGYNDSCPMYTFGGMVVNQAMVPKLQAVIGAGPDYFRSDISAEIYDIRVPRLTKKERVALDFAIPNGRDPFAADFGITDEEKDDYRRIYRFFPSYVETI